MEQRFDLLRMLIRQNPVRQTGFNPEAASFCASLARGIIIAHDLYVSQYPEASPAVGYFATSSIVECIYHLAPVLHYSREADEHAACVSAFNQAHNILVRLSTYTNSAKRAVEALTRFLEKWGSADAASPSSMKKYVGSYPGGPDVRLHHSSAASSRRGLTD